jgi:hypothetical protein
MVNQTQVHNINPMYSSPSRQIIIQRDTPGLYFSFSYYSISIKAPLMAPAGDGTVNISIRGI